MSLPSGLIQAPTAKSVDYFILVSWNYFYVVFRKGDSLIRKIIINKKMSINYIIKNTYLILWKYVFIYGVDEF